MIKKFRIYLLQNFILKHQTLIKLNGGCRSANPSLKVYVVKERWFARRNLMNNLRSSSKERSTMKNVYLTATLIKIMWNIHTIKNSCKVLKIPTLKQKVKVYKFYHSTRFNSRILIFRMQTPASKIKLRMKKIMLKCKFQKSN